VSDGFEQMMDNASIAEWRDEILQNAENVMSGGGLEAEIYRACFATPAGRAVLRDLYQQFCNVTRWYPGEDPLAGAYREGQAQIVYFIAARIEAAEQGEDNANES
jgi:ketosteroid isomerase-like protein